MCRQDKFWFVSGHAFETFEIFVQRVGRALGMQADVRRELGQDVVAGEEQSISAVVEADVAWRMAWRPLDTEPSASHLNRFGAVELHRRLGPLHDLTKRTLRVTQGSAFVCKHSVSAYL